MVNVSSNAGPGRHYHRGMAQVSRESCAGQEATTRSVMCTVCKALYTPGPAHRQLALAPHIVLESAFMSMCHFCFRCRRAACPDCWDAVHGVCGACVEEAGLPFRREVKPLDNTLPPLKQEQQEQHRPAIEHTRTADILVCIQHGRFYREPAEAQPLSVTHPQRMSRPMRAADKGRDRFIASAPPDMQGRGRFIASAPPDMQGRDRFIASASDSLQSLPMMQRNEEVGRDTLGGGRDQSAPTDVSERRGATYHYKPTFEDGRPQGATSPQYKKGNGRPQGATPNHHPSPVPTMTTAWERCVHSRDGGGVDVGGGPLRASVLSPTDVGGGPLRASVLSPTDVGGGPSRASVLSHSNNGQPESLWASVLSHGWVAEAVTAIEQWATGALLVLLLTILTMIAIAEASPSANAQILHVFQIDIRGEVAYLIHLIGQLHW